MKNLVTKEQINNAFEDWKFSLMSFNDWKKKQ